MILYYDTHLNNYWTGVRFEWNQEDKIYKDVGSNVLMYGSRFYLGSNWWDYINNNELKSWNNDKSKKILTFDLEELFTDFNINGKGK